MHCRVEPDVDTGVPHLRIVLLVVLDEPDDAPRPRGRRSRPRRRTLRPSRRARPRPGPATSARTPAHGRSTRAPGRRRGGGSATSRGRRRAASRRMMAADYPGPMRKRLDVLLVERGLAESRAQAQALVIAGLVPGLRQAGRAGRRRRRARASSARRGSSRAAARSSRTRSTSSASTRPAGTASTSARRPADSPTACSSAALRAWSRSTSATGSCIRGSAADPPRDRPRAGERTPARRRCRSRPSSSSATSRSSPPRRVLPPALALAAPGWEALVLVKPQFEAGRADAPQGRRPRPRGAPARPAGVLRRRSLRGMRGSAGVVDSGLPGAEGEPGVLRPPDREREALRPR